MKTERIAPKRIEDLKRWELRSLGTGRAEGLICCGAERQGRAGVAGRVQGGRVEESGG